MYSMWAAVLLSSLPVAWEVPCAPDPGLRQTVPVAIRATPVSESWKLEVRFGGEPPGLRTLMCDSCQSAAQAALLVLKLGDDAGATEPLAAAQSTALVENNAPASTWRVGLWLSALGVLGTAPSLTPRAAVLLTIDNDWFRTGLRVRGGLDTSVALPDLPDAFALQPLVGLELQSCLLSPRRRWRWGGCLEGGIEWMRAAGRQIAAPKEGTAALVSVGAKVFASVQLHAQLTASLSVGPHLSLSRLQVRLDDMAVFSSGPWGGQAELALGWLW